MFGFSNNKQLNIEFFSIKGQNMGRIQEVIYTWQNVEKTSENEQTEGGKDDLLKYIQATEKLFTVLFMEEHIQR